MSAVLLFSWNGSGAVLGEARPRGQEAPPSAGEAPDSLPPSPVPPFFAAGIWDETASATPSTTLCASFCRVCQRSPHAFWHFASAAFIRSQRQGASRRTTEKTATAPTAQSPSPTPVRTGWSRKGWHFPRKRPHLIGRTSPPCNPWRRRPSCSVPRGCRSGACGSRR